MSLSPRPFLLDGKWVSGEKSELLHDRFDGRAIGSYSLADAAQVEAAVESCAVAFTKTRLLSSHQRAEILRRTAELIGQKEADFVDLLVHEAGKPLDFAKIEVTRARQTFHFAANETSHPFGEALAMDATPAGSGHTGCTRRFPLGVIFGITPFNFPLNLVAHKIAPALATGNTILLKPALKTPLIALLLGEVLVEAGILPGQVNIVPFHHDLMPPLFTHAAIKMISFTGSAEVGWQVKAQAVKQRVCLELGGNAALVVHSDADWSWRLPAVASACFGYAGQSCISVQRIFIQQEIYTEFRDAFCEYVAEKVQTGSPAESGVTVGPMIDSGALQKVQRWIDAAVEAGASTLLPVKIEGNCLAPVVLEKVPPGQAISCEEAFAPVVVLEPYDFFSDAIEKVNASRYGLQAGVFTQDQALAERACRELEVGCVLINQVPTFRVENMPYGGIKDSGVGREGVRYTMEEMTELKTFIYNHNQPA